MKAALLQLASPLEEDWRHRIDRVGELVTGLTDVDLVVLPELWAAGYFAFDRYEDLAQPVPGPLVETIRGWALSLGAHVQVGSILERGPSGRLHNTALLIGPSGEDLLEYRKIHVFGYQSLEATLLTPGTRTDVVRTDLGGVGISTCYDLRFPELYRGLVDAGAEIVVVPAAWPMARLGHWRLLTRARAVENQVLLLACNAAGRQGEVELAGHSAVIDPWGRVLGEAGADEEVLVVDIDLEVVSRTRKEFPVLEDRRLDLSSNRPREDHGAR